MQKQSLSFKPCGKMRLEELGVEGACEKFPVIEEGGEWWQTRLDPEGSECQ